MKTTTDYQLIVDHPCGAGFFRAHEQYDTAAALIESAAEYQSGEYPGRVIGAVFHTYNHNGSLIAAAPFPVDAWVAELLADSPRWRATQHALAKEDRLLRAARH